ncbi:hypothetical protein C2S51_029123 [Perilla frutescens var. frutescens]|nr:hypothetical protein C2S51_029123 [Perilla frutescens var. frutescens]
MGKLKIKPSNANAKALAATKIGASSFSGSKRSRDVSTLPTPPSKNLKDDATILALTAMSPPSAVVDLEAPRSSKKALTSSSSKSISLKPFIMDIQKSVVGLGTPEAYEKDSLEQQAFLSFDQMAKCLASHEERFQARVYMQAEELENVAEERRAMADRESAILVERDAARAEAAGAKALLDKRHEAQEAFYQKGRTAVLEAFKEKMSDLDLSFLEKKEEVKAHKDDHAVEDEVRVDAEGVKGMEVQVEGVEPVNDGLEPLISLRVGISCAWGSVSYSNSQRVPTIGYGSTFLGSEFVNSVPYDLFDLIWVFPVWRQFSGPTFLCILEHFSEYPISGLECSKIMSSDPYVRVNGVSPVLFLRSFCFFSFQSQEVGLLRMVICRGCILEVFYGFEVDEPLECWADEAGFEAFTHTGFSSMTRFMLGKVNFGSIFMRLISSVKGESAKLIGADFLMGAGTPGIRVKIPSNRWIFFSTSDFDPDLWPLRLNASTSRLRSQGVDFERRRCRCGAVEHREMVWGLFPVDPLPGENEYYIFRKGTYKAGRKGCDIIINKDKGVSRVHAEIIVNEMICMDHSERRHSNNSSKVQIRDSSKYGTFVNKYMGSKEKVHEYPNKETMLTDGDVIAFGTGNAKYRFSYVPLVLCAWSSKPSEINQLQDKMSLIGASVSQAWTSRCTHMVIDDFIPFNDEIINSIVARKPLVGLNWIELITGKTICTEIPSSLSHAPTLVLEGEPLKVADPQSREQCLKGYTFILESTHKYKFKEKLQLLLDAGGARVVYVETSDQCSQNSGDNLVCVLPDGTSSSGSFKKFNYVPKVKERELISAVVCGRLDPSIMASAPVLVTSSCSTDETVVADSDAELENATSVHTSAAINIIDSAEDECETKMEIHEAEPPVKDCKAENSVHVIESTEHDSLGKTDARTTEHGSQGFLPPKQDTLKPDSPHRSAIVSDSIDITLSRDSNEGAMIRKDKGHTSDSENLDIIYSHSLIVRESNSTQFDHSSRNGPAVNFKRFRKTSAPSGNSFDNLIPFSEYPFKESDYGNEDVAESIKQEKKRKQMEAIADDLFNNEKGRRKASGSLPGLFARR